MKKKILSMLLSVLMLSSVLTLGVSPTDTASEEVEFPFTDVSSSDWFYDAVKTAYEKGLMLGVEDDEFAPKNEMTRAEIVTLLRRLAGEENSDQTFGENVYTDVPNGSWYESAVIWATAKKLVQGDGDGTFRPKDSVSRAEMAVILQRFFQYLGLTLEEAPKIDAFSDADTIPSWARDAAEAMRVAGILGGDENGRFNPKDYAYRCEVAQMIVRFPTLTDPGEGDDVVNPDISVVLPEDMPTVDDLGLLKEENGIRVSNAELIVDTDGNAILGESQFGTHGGHESKVVRTAYGTYAVYINDIYNDATDYYSIVKLTDEGAKVLHTGTLPLAMGSCLPNILTDGEGHVYVSLLAPGGTNKAWLTMVKIDEATETVVSSDHLDIACPVFISLGYSQPVLDVENGKIYALYTGGDVPGYIMWVQYDMTTDKWENKAHCCTVDYRFCYFNAYPDGNGGFLFFAQRDVTGTGLRKKLGIENVTNYLSGYAFDAVYLLQVKDPSRDSINVQPIYEPDYFKIYEEKNAGKDEADKKPVNIVSARFNGHGGTSYLDLEGNLHFIFTETETNQKHHIIFDLDGNKLSEEVLNLSGTKRATYSFVMGQGKSGKYYILAWNTSEKYANLEILVSDDGTNFKREVKTFEVKTADGSFTEASSTDTYLIASSPRNGSLRDGTLNIVFSFASGKTSEVSGRALSNYYHMIVELP